MDLPARQFKAGNFTKVPVLVDRDMFEEPYFTSVSLSTHEQLFADLKTMWQAVPHSVIEKVVDLYPTSVYNGSLIKSAGWFKALFDRGLRCLRALCSETSYIWGLSGRLSANHNRSSFHRRWTESLQNGI